MLLHKHIIELTGTRDVAPCRLKASVRVRRWCPDDAPATSIIWQQALLNEGLTNQWPVLPGQSEETLMKRAADSMLRLHQRKERAALAARVIRDFLRLNDMQVYALHGKRPRSVAEEYRKFLRLDARQKLKKLRQRRMWATLVAEAYNLPSGGEATEKVPSDEAVLASCSCQESSASEESSTSCSNPQVVGYVMISLQQPLALLPPPFPTYSPLCMHVDALAVSPKLRRRGVARALLSSAERLACAWGRRSIWLRVSARNEGAIQLYLGLGYSIHSFKGLPWQRNRDIIMSKSLETIRKPGADASEIVRMDIDKERAVGVYVWGPGDASDNEKRDEGVRA
ncbi:hypothetical protein CEUSTIGMA_g4992.t1 [Chlamydomonas eustigma]|uniref:N-acetyltransferase domain-containing protein n=1 Tax=Chlamydomonas eustigma TaxID=1157962 RepID=A0A250X397_9CHLO|nr:hypothetical protein CEUSTIGMA_g4992.t1 [Chlamydomonas eustigma]|eukprot:GAX77548.1 hypothetical protein CEUSTIGMA_g4992.t1 [Chlamydomonas eustigma]